MQKLWIVPKNARLNAAWISGGRCPQNALPGALLHFICRPVGERYHDELRQNFSVHLSSARSRRCAR